MASLTLDQVYNSDIILLHVMSQQEMILAAELLHSKRLWYQSTLKLDT